MRRKIERKTKILKYDIRSSEKPAQPPASSSSKTGMSAVMTGNKPHGKVRNKNPLIVPAWMAAPPGGKEMREGYAERDSECVCGVFVYTDNYSVKGLIQSNQFKYLLSLIKNF